MLSCLFCEVFKITFFIEHLRTSTSVLHYTIVFPPVVNLLLNNILGERNFKWNVKSKFPPCSRFWRLFSFCIINSLLSYHYIFCIWIHLYLYQPCNKSNRDSFLIKKLILCYFFPFEQLLHLFPRLWYWISQRQFHWSESRRFGNKIGGNFHLSNQILCWTHFRTIFPVYTLWKHKNPVIFWCLQGGIENEYRPGMGSVYCSKSVPIRIFLFSRTWNERRDFRQIWDMKNQCSHNIETSQLIWRAN